MAERPWEVFGEGPLTQEKITGLAAGLDPRDLMLVLTIETARLCAEISTKLDKLLGDDSDD